MCPLRLSYRPVARDERCDGDGAVAYGSLLSNQAPPGDEPTGRVGLKTGQSAGLGAPHEPFSRPFVR